MITLTLLFRSVGAVRFRGANCHMRTINKLPGRLRYPLRSFQSQMASHLESGPHLYSGAWSQFHADIPTIHGPLISLWCQYGWYLGFGHGYCWKCFITHIPSGGFPLPLERKYCQCPSILSHLGLELCFQLVAYSKNLFLYY